MAIWGSLIGGMIGFSLGGGAFWNAFRFFDWWKNVKS